MMDETRIPLRNRYKEVVGYCLIDADDFPLVGGHNWSLSTNGYAKSLINGKWTRMHRLILGISDSKHDVNAETDHINRDKLDNRRSNLRIVSRSENLINRRVMKTSKSGIRYAKRLPWGKWRSRLQRGGKEIYLGHYDTAELANKAALDYDRLNREKEAGRE